MQSLPKPERIFTHESDLDGLVSGLLLQMLARKEFGEEVEVEPHHYPSWRMRNLTERNAWVCDFTFEKRLDRHGWLIIDHHATELRPQEGRFIHDLEKSASLLCYELCNQHGIKSEKLDRIVHLSNLADLYIDSDPEFQLAIDYANLVKTYGFRNINRLIGGDLERLIDHPLLEVIQTKRRVEDPMGFEWSRQHVQRVTDELGVMETAVGDSNAIVHRLLEEGSSGFRVIATMFQKANRQMTVSFRSLHGEALPIARKFQGGGHANACGATLPKSVNSLNEAIGYMRQHLEPEAVSGGLSSLEQAFSGLDLG